MQTFILVVLELVVALLSDAVPLVVPYFESTLSPCPQTAPADIDIDQLLGDWHLSLLVLDSTADYPPGALDSAPTCASVQLLRSNASQLRLDWTLHQLGVPGGLADLRLQVPAIVSSNPAVWALATPLGGEMLGMVQHAAAHSFMVLSVCGDRDQAQAVPVHVLTALLTRSTPSSLGALELLRLSKLMRTGRRLRQDERLLSWADC